MSEARCKRPETATKTTARCHPQESVIVFRLRDSKDVSPVNKVTLGEVRNNNNRNQIPKLETKKDYCLIIMQDFSVAKVSLKNDMITQGEP